MRYVRHGCHGRRGGVVLRVGALMSQISCSSSWLIEKNNNKLGRIFLPFGVKPCVCFDYADAGDYVLRTLTPLRKLLSILLLLLLLLSLFIYFLLCLTRHRIKITWIMKWQIICLNRTLWIVVRDSQAFLLLRIFWISLAFLTVKSTSGIQWRARARALHWMVPRKDPSKQTCVSLPTPQGGFPFFWQDKQRRHLVAVFQYGWLWIHQYLLQRRTGIFYNLSVFSRVLYLQLYFRCYVCRAPVDCSFDFDWYVPTCTGSWGRSKTWLEGEWLCSQQSDINGS